MAVTYHFAALHYLNLWLQTERSIHEKFTVGNREQRLEALDRAAAHFRIARNLQKKYDEGKGVRRYEPVLEIIDGLNETHFENDIFGGISQVRDQISAAYGGREVLSATTKFLWVKFRSPIILYDSQARKALNTPNGDLKSYYDAWRAKFNVVKRSIADACAALTDVIKYTVDSAIATKPFVQRISRQEWFQQRVLDSYLWHVGSG